MTQRSALLLDLDGTLADSLPALRRVYDEFLSTRGIVSSQAEFDRLNGPPLGEVIESLRVTHGLVKPHVELLAEYFERVTVAYRTIQVADGGRDLITRARREGWKVGIVTSNVSRVTHAWIEGQNVVVDAVVCGDEVSRGKPRPEPYLEALRQLEADPACSVAVEDSPTGTLSALAAQLRVFGVGTPASPWPEGVVACDDLSAVSREVWGD